MIYSRGGIEAVNPRLLRAPRVEEILGQFGASIGEETVLHGPLVIHNAAHDYGNLRIGDRVHIGRLVILDLAEPLVLEDDSVVSMGATLLTHSDVGDRPLAARYPRRSAGVRIGRAAYIGANVTVLPGCDVGNASVVGAGAVVTHPVGDGVAVAGVPARPLPPSARQSRGSGSTGTTSAHTPVGEAEGVEIIDEI